MPTPQPSRRGFSRRCGCAALPSRVAGSSYARELPPPAEPGSERGRARSRRRRAADRASLLRRRDAAALDALRRRLAAGRAAEARRAARRDASRTACRARASTPRSTGTASACRTTRTACPISRSSRSGRARHFAYSFVPPDTGTFFFHPHCNTAEQLGRGMAGVLIVEGDESEPYDADVPIVLRDWRIDDAGGDFLPFFTPEGAGKAGTFGTIRSANGEIESGDRPAGRRRLPAAAAQPRQHARHGDRHRGRRGGDRRDRRHRAAAGAAEILAARAGDAARHRRARAGRRRDGAARRLFRRRAGAARAARPARARRGARTAFDPAPLRAGRIPEPDLDNAERLPFAFSATADGDAARRSGGAGPAARLALQRRRDVLGDQQEGLAGRRPQPRAAAARDA